MLLSPFHKQKPTMTMTYIELSQLNMKNKQYKLIKYMNVKAFDYKLTQFSTNYSKLHHE